jgi:hypothetical protein
VDTTLLQQDGARPHIVNAVFDILPDVHGRSVPQNQFPECFRCG